jgi:hypothetical protein
MPKRVWRPLNTYGLLFVAAAITVAITYSILELNSVCSAL